VTKMQEEAKRGGGEEVKGDGESQHQLQLSRQHQHQSLQPLAPKKRLALIPEHSNSNVQNARESAREHESA